MPPMYSAPVSKVLDPVKFVNKFWPNVYLYDKQVEIMYSLRDNDETVVPAGNMLGKDFVGALACLWFFLSRHPCRVVTTSVDNTQLNAVLWGEMRRFIQTAAQPLTHDKGGPLLVNNLHIRKYVRDNLCGLSYIIGRVASDTGEGFLGHHIASTGDGVPRTLFFVDEASGVPDVYYEKADTWANRKLIVGNPFECQNFFKHAVKGRPGSDDAGGDIARTNGKGFIRKVIHIGAQDSPNVKLGLLQVARGEEPTYEVLVPGVKDYATYEKNIRIWDKVKQTISLNGQFYEGAEVLMFPPEWLDRSAKIAQDHVRLTSRTAKAMGVDTSSGGDTLSWCVVDEFGILDLHSVPFMEDTSDVMTVTLRMMAKWNLKGNQVLFDAGGGGKEHADYLKKIANIDGIRAVGFGESVSFENAWKKMKMYKEIRDERETRVVYKNRRAQMYDLLRIAINPMTGSGFGIPAHLHELRRQLAPIPLLYDGEGKLYLPPKRRTDPDSDELCLIDIVGRSPDDADALVLAMFGMMTDEKPSVAGAF
jgi:hypothetical protein